MLNALWIVIIGMLIIFAVLGILMAVMLALGRIFRPKEEKATG